MSMTVWRVTQSGEVEAMGEFEAHLAQDVADVTNAKNRAVGPCNVLYVAR